MVIEKRKQNKTIIKQITYPSIVFPTVLIGICLSQTTSGKKKKIAVHVLKASMVKTQSRNHAYLTPEYVLCLLYIKILTYWQFDNSLNIMMVFSCYLQRGKIRISLLVCSIWLHQDDQCIYRKVRKIILMY